MPSWYSHEKFNPEGLGFFDVVPYIDGFGFSFKKKLKNDSRNVSIIKISIFNKYFKDESLVRKPLNVSATYGFDTGQGVQIRRETSFNEPIDLETSGIFYDSSDGRFYDGSKEITGEEIIRETYDKHIRTTKPIRGILIRTKIISWKTVRWFFEKVSTIFKLSLKIIYGDKYSYNYILGEEILNGETIASKYRDINNTKQKEIEGDDLVTIEFFGQKVRPRPILVYSIMHFIFYWLSMYLFKGNVPSDVRRIFTNNFLTITYAIFSFWIVRDIVPIFLKCLVREFSSLAAKIEYRKIRI